ncbi:MAG: decaprenyl-phosphate phosphoribosyltransferase [Deltaproteobacteria bacterium]|nr:decaprenyl-phosphate phosphoribosyltransferase [Deltaproteobacteria bacterium]MBW2398918.1 decaprenyl-phosphate phosphoribosyltransferase [Deltaproteobacteria bacterium]
MFRLMRPRQWTKNLLLFAALIFANKFFDADSVILACLGFATFCLASSSAYVVNDLLDVDRDRRHPVKRNRPVASGDVSPGNAAALAFVLTVAALGIAFKVAPAFGVATVAYLASTHFYSLIGKNVVILDVLMIAFGFVIRAIAGALAIDVPISDWFILCTAFLALFLAVSKRKSELISLKEDAESVRPVLARYTETSLNTFTAVTMSAAMISYGLYVLDFQRAHATDSRLLMLTFPIVVFGIFRYHHLTETTDMGDKPEEVLLRDRPIQACGVLFAAFAVIALYFAN